MMFSKPAALLLGSVAALSLAACSQPEQTSPTALISTAPFVWPATLRVVGDGYPAAGAPCRRIGETAATVDYLDDSADLVGCPASDQAAIAALGGKSLGQVDGVALISVPRRAPQVAEAEDARLPGTAFNAVASIGCRGPGLPSSGQCKAGVVRRADRSADVTLLLDEGKGRTLSFDAQGQTRDPGARSTMTGEDTVTVTIGQQRYDVPTAFLWGG
ncbi:hypothetical protein [Phenylobacterium sp.]|uniref:hypothetical protein n=1 Tax=Phenylobacterium sp. TaxID=1871053 RepID=UPI00272F512C|nr:hypothetical protein [Phenylobacterium sp.]MDP1599887.1 hypothetical protein [Phenylobacterium sp.]MDP3591161.1 hypothetical protein [Phenylobacterium sp.]